MQVGVIDIPLVTIFPVTIGLCPTVDHNSTDQKFSKEKGKGFPYSIPSVGPGADPGGRLPLLSARPAVTSPAAEHHRPLAGTKLYCLVTETLRCKQLAQGCYAALSRVGFEPATY